MNEGPIGFIGLGNMGSRMVKRLIEAKEKRMEASEARDGKRKKPLKNPWTRGPRNSLRGYLTPVS